MSQTAPRIQITPPGKHPIKLPGKLPGVPRGPLSPQQQLEALKRVQAQAEQRVKLGLQLFKAAEAHTMHQQNVLQQVRAEQGRLRGQLQHDVARSLQAYDQWVGQIDESFTKAIQALDEKVGKLQSDWRQTQRRIESTMRRSEALLDQARYLVESAAKDAGQTIPSPTAAPKPVSPPKPKAVKLVIKTNIAATDTAQSEPDPSDKPPRPLSVSPTKLLESDEGAQDPNEDSLYTDILDKLRDAADADNGDEPA
ncbi:MAG: hypothetical protein V3U29_09190 [Phycisphaeraceae bacterium]